jgi:hypothetical protein
MEQVCFATVCLTNSNDGSIVAINDVLDLILDTICLYFVYWSIFIKGLVKIECPLAEFDSVK